jgi:chromosome partition protein MukB
MSRTRAQALTLVNWKGVFYERYLIDRHVTAFEGVNGAGKTTVMIAAYLVLLPDMSRLRFTNLGETGATGGDKGIWGRLGEQGRPSYSVIDFAITPDRRLIAGVHIERKGEPSIEPTPFIITGLDASVRLQDVLLLPQGEVEVVPELSELRENTARFGGRLQVYSTARDYFAALFEQGVTPLRLGTDEERNKLNEMLRTSMTGGISRALTSELRSFLLKEESGLADTLQRMKANLDACRRTRTEVQESQRLEKEIGGVFEAGQTMFAAAFLATRERADEMQRRVADAEVAHTKAQEKLTNVQEQLAHVCEELSTKSTRQENLTKELTAAEGWLQRLQQALEAAQEVARWVKEVASAENNVRVAEGERVASEAVRNQRRVALRRCQEEYTNLAAGLADLQQGIEGLHRRAGAYKQAVRRKQEAETLLGAGTIPVHDLGSRITACTAKLAEVDRTRREVKQQLADVAEHKREHAVALEALEFMTGEAIDPQSAHAAALARLRWFRDSLVLAGHASTIAAELAKTRKLATRQAEARARAQALGLSFTEQEEPAGLQIGAQLEQVEQERQRLQKEEGIARAGISDCQRTLENARLRQKELADQEPLWLDLSARARRLEEHLDLPLRSLEELQTVREVVSQRLADITARETDLVQSRERLHAEARELLAAGGPFDPELLKLKDSLGADLLATIFEDTSIEEAGILEAHLGSLVQALVVDDPRTAAVEIHGRSDALPHVWLMSRDQDVVQLGLSDAPHAPNEIDVIVPERRAFRVSRVPSRPLLGRKAREKRAEELRAEAGMLDGQIEAVRAERRGVERLKEDGESLLAGHMVWLKDNPASELAMLRHQLIEVEAQQGIHKSAAIRHREAARQLAPRIDALRSLLAEAVLLDPPDHANRLEALEEEHRGAITAQAETRRCRDAVRVVEDKLDSLRRLPLSDADIERLGAELDRLSRERGKLDAAIEAMEYVASNAEALNWGDAPVQLETEKSLVPVLQEQLTLAKRAVEDAESASRAAEETFNRAMALWQDADGERRAATAQLEASEYRFAAMGVPDPTPTAIDEAQDKLNHLKEEAKTLASQLDILKNDKGRHAAEQDQAAHECDEAGEKVAAERREAAPALERWNRLRTTVSEHNLLASVLPPGKNDVSGIRGHVNLVQEARQQRAVLVERLRAAQRTQDLLIKIDKDGSGSELAFADVYLELWLSVRDWLRRRLPAQIAEVDDPREALLRLRDQLLSLEERLARQENDLRGASEDVARGIDVQIRKARGQVQRLTKNLEGVSFGSIHRIRVKLQPVERMEQILRALREGAVQGLLFQENLAIEEALDEIFRRYGGGKTGGQRLLDYREYVLLQAEVCRKAGSEWEAANPTRLSTGEAIGVGAALMMVVLTEWERDANLLRGKKSRGSLRLLFLDEANRLSHDNLGVLFDLCQTLDLQLLIAAPEVARAEGNTTYRLVRRTDTAGREEVVVSGRRTRADA